MLQARWRLISQRLMRTTGIIPVDPLGDSSPCFLKTGEIVLPNAFFLQTPKEALIDAVLFRRIRLMVEKEFFVVKKARKEYHCQR